MAYLIFMKAPVCFLFSPPAFAFLCKKYLFDAKAISHFRISNFKIWQRKASFYFSLPLLYSGWYTFFNYLLSFNQMSICFVCVCFITKTKKAKGKYSKACGKSDNRTEPMLVGHLVLTCCICLLMWTNVSCICFYHKN